ncbi:hypothetical protein Tco_0772740 [Tanacetum coccineum]|uniref:Retrotransposon gag domain-containing protein n=1 Tax=Tanacetum coccineum TaxID=301880 RepID=A0ABQ4ZIR7_9ASTR
MTRSLTKDLFTPYEEPERVLHSTRKLFKTMSLDYSSLPKFDLFSDLEDQCQEEVTKAMGEPTMEEYMTKTREDYGSEIARPKIDEKAHFELKEPDETLYQAWERFKELLLRCPQHYLTDMQEVILFYKGLDVPTRQILDSKSAIPSMKVVDAKKAIQDVADHSQKCLGREIQKVNKRVYAAQVGCESCGRPHYTKDCPLKEEGKHLKKHTTLNLEYHSPKEEDIEQLLWDSTNETMEVLQIKSEDKQ